MLPDWFAEYAAWEHCARLIALVSGSCTANLAPVVLKIIHPFLHSFSMLMLVS